MCGQSSVMEVLCFERRLVCFFRFNELKLNDCCYCCGKQRSADQLFRKLACVFCGCMHFISVPSDILLRLAVFCFSKMHIFPNLNSAKFMTYKYLKISHGDQSLRIHTRRYNDSKIFNRSQICSDYLCFFSHLLENSGLLQSKFKLCLFSPLVSHRGGSVSMFFYQVCLFSGSAQREALRLWHGGFHSEGGRRSMSLEFVV